MSATGLKARMDAGETVFAAWLTFDAPRVAGALARDGWDAVVVDMQHGLAGYREMVDAVALVAAAGVAPVVRVPVGDDALIGRAPDAGAVGIICPMINSGQEAAWFARGTKYPPLGQRSWAPGQALQVLGLSRDDYLAGANEFVVSFAMVETAQALRHIDAICSTPGIDAIFVGPNDLSLSLSEGAAVDPARPEVQQALAQVVRKCAAHGVVPAVYANTPELAVTCRTMGFRFIAVGSDAGYLAAGSRAMLAAARE